MRQPGAAAAAAQDAVRLMKTARTAALATLDRGSGAPYASLVTVALDAIGAPVLLLSDLARHTMNIGADPRASLLYVPADPVPGDALAESRVTVMGRLHPTSSPAARAGFLARHPDAAAYASFADFRFYAFAIESAHFIGGFGRIVEVPGHELAAAMTAES